MERPVSVAKEAGKRRLFESRDMDVHGGLEPLQKRVSMRSICSSEGGIACLRGDSEPRRDLECVGSSWRQHLDGGYRGYGCAGSGLGTSDILAAAMKAIFQFLGIATPKTIFTAPCSVWNRLCRRRRVAGSGRWCDRWNQVYYF